MEVLWFSIIIPAFPELISYYGISELQVTLGLSVYSLFAFLAAPILGQWSDKIGRKKSLARCILGTSISYFLMIVTPTYIVFLIARAINGITGWNISIIQAILTDISPNPEEKRKNFGIMGALFGIGFILWPFLGSLILWRGGVNAIFIFGGCLAALQLFFVLFTFHNTNNEHLDDTKIIQRNPFKTIRKFIIQPTLKPWLLSFMSLGIAMFVVNSSQSLYMHNLFGTSGERYGYILAVSGLIMAINMGILIPKFWTKKFSTRALLILVFSCMIVGYTLLGLMQTELSYIITLYTLMFLINAYGVVYNVYIMSHAHKKEVGELSWMLWSLQSLFMVIGPIVGWFLLEADINIHWWALVFFAIGIIIMIKPLVALPKWTQNHMAPQPQTAH